MWRTRSEVQPEVKTKERKKWKGESFEFLKYYSSFKDLCSESNNFKCHDLNLRPSRPLFEQRNLFIFSKQQEQEQSWFRPERFTLHRKLTRRTRKFPSVLPSFLPHRLSWLLLWPLPSRATIVPMQRRDRQLALPLDNWRSAQTLWVVLKVERVCECSLCVYSTDFWTKVLKRRNFSHQRFMMEGCNEKWQIRRRTDVCVALCRCCENDDRLHILGSFQSLSFCIILTFYSNFWSFLAFASIFLKIVMC